MDEARHNLCEQLDIKTIRPGVIKNTRRRGRSEDRWREPGAVAAPQPQGRRPGTCAATPYPLAAPGIAGLPTTPERSARHIAPQRPETETIRAESDEIAMRVTAIANVRTRRRSACKVDRDDKPTKPSNGARVDGTHRL